LGFWPVAEPVENKLSSPTLPKNINNLGVMPGRVTP
jgi:hypothetical protein